MSPQGHTEAHGPLAGIVVVAVEQAVAAPFATRQLADLGADVIKVERTGDGDFARGYDATVRGQSSHFVWLNRGKRSITLDVKADEGRRTLGELVARADVVVQNLAPAAARRLGIDAHTLAAAHPRLVACDVSGYGADGPYSDRKAYDLLIQCDAGLVSITGTPDEPAKAGISIADIAAGMYAYTGILTALYDRERTGRGRALEVSMLEALGEWMGYPELYARYGGTSPRRAGAAHATIAPYGPVATASGHVITIGVQNEREWAALCTDVLERPDLVDDPRFRGNAARAAHRAELDEAIEGVSAGLDVTEAERRLDAAGIAHVRQRSLEEFARHPQLQARERWMTVGTPQGDIEMLRPPVTAGWASLPARVPAVGEHDDEVRAWLRTTDASREADHR